MALSRVIDMLRKLEPAFGVPVALSPTSTECVQPLTELRNAFAHIEDRAMGQVRNKHHPDALSIFDQRDLLRDGTPDHHHTHGAACTGLSSRLTAQRKPTSSRATATTAICGRFRYDR